MATSSQTTISLILIGCCLSILTPEVLTDCTWTDDVCEFWLEVDHRLTMMQARDAVYAHQGKLYRYDVTNTSEAEPVDPAEVITADGWEDQRLVAVVNGSMPGPTIIVYEGQKLIIHVKNMMTSNALTIHWHGLHQKGTGFMDGVPYVTQCPIMPYGSFKYEFEAYPKGTFWYHSHAGSQLSQGLVGAFIIREKRAPIMEEHIVMLMEWNHAIDADLMHMKMVYGNFENRVQFVPTRSLEGGRFSNFIMESGLINGKGRYYEENGVNTETPLEVFDVERGQNYRFRLIGSGSLYPFRFSIDGHVLTVVATDGYELEPTEVESLVINPGERYDVIVAANQTVANYWVRAESLEVNVYKHIAEAILRYSGAAEEEPTTDRKQCSQADGCLVFNCPFTYYPADTFTFCQHLDDIRASEDTNTPGASGDEEIQDVFLNFAFPGIDHFPASVNGRSFAFSPVNMLTQPQEVSWQCDNEDCGDDKNCRCSSSIDLEYNKIYQFVFLNMGAGKGWPHPIHMHGHSFHVLKMGYPTYNDTTGELIDDNMDIDCRGHSDRDRSFCNSATWANRSWGGNDVPDLNLDRAPLKDTIIVPTGGYVVVRIRADNPGLWFMHCHIELHNLDGMAIMINESFSRHPPPPKGSFICGDFEAGRLHQDILAQGQLGEDDNDYSKEEFWGAVGALIAVVVVLLIIIIVLSCRGVGAPKSGAGSAAPHTDGFQNNAFNGK